jgi:hypothetical protein
LTGARKGSISFLQGKSVTPSFLVYFFDLHYDSSLDQTTRIHGMVPTTDGTISSWHELSRPQVHGYDLLDVAFLDALKFVSIADEKVARVFEAPQGFVSVLESLGVANFKENDV